MEIELNAPHNKVQDSLKTILLRNFLGGIAWAIGLTIGFSLLIATLRLLSGYIDLIPIVGTFISDVIDFVLSYNRNLR